MICLARGLRARSADFIVSFVLQGAIGALYGPLHGGANEAVLRMLSRIGTRENVPAFIEAVKARREIMFGFGHRVYKNYDPRAKIIRYVVALYHFSDEIPLFKISLFIFSPCLGLDYLRLESFVLQRDVKV